jgi:hypothetical protein
MERGAARGRDSPGEVGWPGMAARDFEFLNFEAVFKEQHAVWIMGPNAVGLTMTSPYLCHSKVRG